MVLGRAHPALHAQVDALQARGVHHLGRIAHQHAAGEGQARHGVPAADGQGLGAVLDHPAPFQHGLDARVGLELLQGQVGVREGVPGVQAHHVAHRQAGARHLVDEGAARFPIRLRPAGAVQDEAVRDPSVLDLPDLLGSRLEELRVDRVRLEPQHRVQFPGQVAPGPFPEHRHLGLQAVAGLEIGAGRAVGVDALVGGLHPDHPPVLPQHLHPGEPRQEHHVDPRHFPPLDLLGHPADHPGQGNDGKPVVAQERRRHRRAHAAALGEQPDLLALHLPLAGEAPLPVVRAQLLQGRRVQHRAGEGMVPDGVPFLDQPDRQAFQPGGAGGGVMGFDQVQEPPQPGEVAGSGAHEQDVEFQLLPFQARAGGLGRKIAHGHLQARQMPVYPQRCQNRGHG